MRQGKFSPRTRRKIEKSGAAALAKSFREKRGSEGEAKDTLVTACESFASLIDTGHSRLARRCRIRRA